MMEGVNTKHQESGLENIGYRKWYEYIRESDHSSFLKGLVQIANYSQKSHDLFHIT